MLYMVKSGCLITREALDATPLSDETYELIYENYWFDRPDREEFLDRARDWAMERFLLSDRSSGYNHEIRAGDVAGLIDVLISTSRNLRKDRRSVVWRDIMNCQTHRAWHDAPPGLTKSLANEVHDDLLHEAIAMLQAEGTLSFGMCARGGFWTLSPSKTTEMIHRLNRRGRRGRRRAA